MWSTSREESCTQRFPCKSAYFSITIITTTTATAAAAAAAAAPTTTTTTTTTTITTTNIIIIIIRPIRKIVIITSMKQRGTSAQIMTMDNLFTLNSDLTGWFL